VDVHFSAGREHFWRTPGWLQGLSDQNCSGCAKKWTSVPLLPATERVAQQPRSPTLDSSQTPWQRTQGELVSSCTPATFNIVGPGFKLHPRRFQHRLDWFQLTPPNLEPVRPWAAATHHGERRLVRIVHHDFPRGVAKQVENESKTEYQFITLYLQALKRSAVNPAPERDVSACTRRHQAFALAHV